MRYLASQSELGGQTADTLSVGPLIAGREKPDQQAQKWPLWRTVVAVSLFCSAFWGLLISLLV